MTKKKLETFKVADKHAPRVKPSQGAGKADGDKPEAMEAPETLGFERIEALLDNERPGDVQRSLVQLIDALDTYTADARNPKDRAQGKKAKMAVERTVDLLAFLFNTKEAMLASFTQGRGNKKSAPAKGRP